MSVESIRKHTRYSSEGVTAATHFKFGRARGSATRSAASQWPRRALSRNHDARWCAL